MQNEIPSYLRGVVIIPQDKLAEARDMQAELAPYSDSTIDELQTQAVIRTGANVVDEAVIQAPCGWINLDGSAAYDLEIELLGIADL